MRAVMFDAYGPPEVLTQVELPTTGLVTNSLLTLGTALTGGRRVRTGMSVRKHAALAALRDLLAEERLQVVIDRSYPMTEIVEAHRHVDAGHKVGNVVIDVSPARDR
ncbi:zinc-binding dehydrogenase [Verrucosispora sp. WMMA2044]|nr:zinc-binding dehydrogenase [Verrucosispora sp. WMMA2044]WBB50856.1 zinc-binding dehydrogenase [Verrucosispora sp. WMMA2044]